MFSIMTTEPSTISPKSIAPRLIKLPEIPPTSIPQKANSMESGIAAATISPPRRLPSSSSRTTIDQQTALGEVGDDGADRPPDELVRS